MRLHLQCIFVAVLKLRLKAEEYFYEAYLDEQTYQALIKVCAEELEIEGGSILKIIELPDVIIRNDRDVEHLQTGTKLEIILI